MTTAAQDALESLMEPLALRLATTPTFGSALATAPKVLSDIMESLLGGVFLDSGAYGAETTRVCIYKYNRGDPCW
jgi:dsRNA-specific ribonuclease